MNKKHFYTAVILLLFLAVGIQPALAQILIPGDESVGTWILATRTYTLNGNITIPIQEDGLVITEGNLTLDGAGYSVKSTFPTNPPPGGYLNTTGINLPSGITAVTVKNVTVSEFMYGIYLYSSDDNIICNNILSNNGSENDGGGIRLNYYSDNNIINGNTISNNYNGIVFFSSNDNNIYNNNFFDNTANGTHKQVRIFTSSGNLFSLPLPIGGNYWSDWSGSGSYTFNGGEDALPWVLPNGWTIDTDGDGLSNYDEIIYGTNPNDPDTDDDGLFDGTEVDMAAGSGCPDPLDPDSDGDTLLDGVEVDMGTSPCNVDSDDDGVNDNIDPTPLNPGVTQNYIEAELRADADFILTIDLNLFTGPNNNANKGRRGSLSNRANAAANQVANANYQEAVDILFSLLDRVDGVEPPKDWMFDSPEKEALEIDLMVMIELLGYYL